MIAREQRRLVERPRAGTRLGALARSAGLALIVVWTVVSLSFGTVQLVAQGRDERVDFFTFLASANEWRAGRDPYVASRTVPGADGLPMLVHPNLNHPVMIPPFAPLTALSPAAAYYLWSALGVLLWAAAVALALRVAGARAEPAGWLAVAALAATLPGVTYGLQLGQVALPLALLTVCCWAGLRHPAGSPAALAGAVGIGVLVALKPFFFPLLLIFVPRRDWRALLAAGAGGMGISLLALPFMGIGAFRTWLRLGGTVDWYDHGFNSGLSGVLWRSVSPAPPNSVTWAIAAVVALAAAATLYLAPPAGLSRLDRNIAVLLVASMLGSPLGWLYYTPLLLPAFAALFAARRALAPATRLLALAGCGLLWVPHVLLPALPEAIWSQLTLRATMTWGLVLLWAALAVPVRQGVPVTGTGAEMPKG